MSEQCTILVGAEGVSELEAQGVPWFRSANEGEAQALSEQCGRPLDALLIDSTGRPYFASVVTDDAPPDVWERAQRNLRVVRL